MPCRMAKPRLPIVGRLAGAFPVAPDVPVSFRIRARGTRLLEPGVLIGGVIGHQIHDHADVSLFCLADQAFEIRERAVKGVNGGVVGDVVPEIHER